MLVPRWIPNNNNNKQIYNRIEINKIKNMRTPMICKTHERSEVFFSTGKKLINIILLVEIFNISQCFVFNYKRFSLK